jgi:hypothetical protein
MPATRGRSTSPITVQPALQPKHRRAAGLEPLLLAIAERPQPGLEPQADQISDHPLHSGSVSTGGCVSAEDVDSAKADPPTDAASASGPGCWSVDRQHLWRPDRDRGLRTRSHQGRTCARSVAKGGGKRGVPTGTGTRNPARVRRGSTVRVRQRASLIACSAPYSVVSFGGVLVSRRPPGVHERPPRAP